MTDRDRGLPSHRVAIDVGAVSVRPTGVSIYVSELVRGLTSLAPDQIVSIGAEARRDRPFEGPRHLAWLQTSADADARAAGASVAHYTNAIAPVRSRTPFVLTVLDLSVLRRPRDHPIRRLALAPFIVAAARRARFVVVPSRATALEVGRLLHIPRERLVTIPLAARALAGVTEDPDRAARLLASLGIDEERFILSLGTIEPRKNHVRLLAAFERLGRHDPDLRLVLAGGAGWRSGPFRRALSASPMRDRVVLAGRLPDADIAVLLRSCAVMAYPSLYEGYGLPVIEAMAAGSPVVTSTVSSLPEAAGGAAVLVDPRDVGSIAAGIEEAIDRRAVLIEAGLARAAERTWLDVARETLAVYGRVDG